jgi:hypothetical protein
MRSADPAPFRSPPCRCPYPNGAEPAPRKRCGLRVTTYDGVVGLPEFQRAQPRCGGRRAHERLAAGHVLGIVLRMDGASGVQEIVGPFAQQAGLRVPSPLRTPRSLRPGRTGRPS